MLLKGLTSPYFSVYPFLSYCLHLLFFSSLVPLLSSSYWSVSLANHAPFPLSSLLFCRNNSLYSPPSSVHFQPELLRLLFPFSSLHFLFPLSYSFPFPFIFLVFLHFSLSLFLLLIFFPLLRFSFPLNRLPFRLPLLQFLPLISVLLLSFVVRVILDHILPFNLQSAGIRASLITCIK